MPCFARSRAVARLASGTSSLRQSTSSRTWRSEWHDSIDVAHPPLRRRPSVLDGHSDDKGGQVVSGGVYRRACEARAQHRSREARRRSCRFWRCRRRWEPKARLNAVDSSVLSWRAASLVRCSLGFGRRCRLIRPLTRSGPIPARRARVSGRYRPIPSRSPASRDRHESGPRPVRGPQVVADRSACTATASALHAQHVRRRRDERVQPPSRHLRIARPRRPQLSGRHAPRTRPPVCTRSSSDAACARTTGAALAPARRRPASPRGRRDRRRAARRRYHILARIGAVDGVRYPGRVPRRLRVERSAVRAR